MDKRIQREKWERCHNSTCKGRNNFDKCCAQDVCQWVDGMPWRGTLKGISTDF